MKISFVIIICLIITVSIIGCTDNHYSYFTADEMPTIEYTVDTFVGFDYTFNNEGLNTPYSIEENPVSKEIVVSDENNNCIYIFDSNGNFVRKVGRVGQGPGDLMGPRHIAIDKDGDIYVYEVFNQRISIFSHNGKFKNSFRVNSSNLTDFYVNENKEIYIYVRGSDFFITVFDTFGNVIKEIGKIPEHIIESRWGRNFTRAIPIVEDEKIIIILPLLRLVKIYDDEKLIKELNYSEIFGDLIIKERYTKLNEYQGGGFFSSGLILNVDYIDGDIYIMSRPDVDSKDKVFFISDTDFRIKRKIVLSDEKRTGGFSFTVLQNNNQILFANKSTSEILRLLPK